MFCCRRTVRWGGTHTDRDAEAWALLCQVVVSIKGTNTACLVSSLWGKHFPVHSSVLGEAKHVPEGLQLAARITWCTDIEISTYRRTVSQP